LNTLSLLWGVRGFYYDKFDSTDKTIRDVNQILKAEKLVESGQIVINTASIPIEKKGKTNMIKVTIVD
jgi:pyruvate kinase